MPQAGERVAGKYVLQERLGEGNFGEVWLARHAALGTPVAVKFLRKHPERLLQEAEIAASLEHPHIVRVYRVDPERAAIVMEYVDGPNLRDWAAQRRPSREKILTVLDQVAAALDFVHQKGLVHGDVKPTNILIAQDPGGAPMKELFTILDDRMTDEDRALVMYLEMLRAWQRAHNALREALAQWPDLRDDKDLLPVLAPERVPWTRRVRQAAPQVLAALALSLPFALGFFILALQAIARRGAP